MDSLTILEKIMKAAELLNDSRLPSPMPLVANGFMGTPIIESPHTQDLVPVIELSEHIQVSDEFRKKTNSFYIKMFGFREPTVWMTPYGLMMGPRTAKMIIGAVSA